MRLLDLHVLDRSTVQVSGTERALHFLRSAAAYVMTLTLRRYGQLRAPIDSSWSGKADTQGRSRERTVVIYRNSAVYSTSSLQKSGGLHMTEAE